GGSTSPGGSAGLEGSAGLAGRDVTPGHGSRTAEVKPVDRVVGLYAVLSGLALLSPGRPEHWPLLAVIHLLLACLLLPADWIVRVVKPVGERLPPTLASFLRDWH